MRFRLLIVLLLTISGVRFGVRVGVGSVSRVIGMKLLPRLLAGVPLRERISPCEDT